MTATVWEGSMSEASMKDTLDGVLAVRVTSNSSVPRVRVLVAM